MEWLKNDEHIIFLLSGCIFIIVIQGIIIFKLSQYKSAEEKERDRQEGKIARFRSFWGSFVVYVISTSLISLFLASFVSKQNITLNDINTWVSLILGMVALVIGVISLFLSFYNVDQAYQSQKDSLSEIEKSAKSLSVENLKFYTLTCRGILTRCYLQNREIRIL